MTDKIDKDKLIEKIKELEPYKVLYQYDHKKMMKKAICRKSQNERIRL